MIKVTFQLNSESKIEDLSITGVKVPIRISDLPLIEKTISDFMTKCDEELPADNYYKAKLYPRSKNEGYGWMFFFELHEIICCTAYGL